MLDNPQVTQKKVTTVKRLIKYYRLADSAKIMLRGETLESLLAAAFSPDNPKKIGAACSNRVHPGTEKIFINHFFPETHTDSITYFFGELVSFGDKNHPFAVDQDLERVFGLAD